MKRFLPFLVLLLFIAVCLGAGVAGSLATSSQIAGWYQSLNKPSWTPPNSWFGPVWTALYIMMAVAAWLVWRRGGFRQQARPLTIFGIQLLLNTAWSFIFFGAHQIGLALLEILILWVAILATISAFYRQSRVAAALLVPYLLWVSYASALNGAIWRLNG